MVILILGWVQGGDLLELHQQQDDKPAKASSGEVERIGIERLRCYAGCQDYTLIVEADGHFTYEGRYDVERMGRHTGTVADWYLLRVIDFMEDMNFMQLNTSYTNEFLDGPSVYTMMEKGGSVHVVENYASEGPASLWALEQLIDEMLETAEWDSPEEAM